MAGKKLANTNNNKGQKCVNFFQNVVFKLRIYDPNWNR